MKITLKEHQIKLLLRKSSNHQSLSHIREQQSKTKHFVLLQISAGLFFGLPIGVCLYYITVFLYYLLFLTVGLIGWLILYFLRIIGSNFPGFPGHRLQDALNYGPVCTIILAICATVFQVLITRKATKSAYRYFALIQFPLALITSLVLFFLMFVLHKPLLPFYGQWSEKHIAISISSQNCDQLTFLFVIRGVLPYGILFGGNYGLSLITPLYRKPNKLPSGCVTQRVIRYR